MPINHINFLSLTIKSGNHFDFDGCVIHDDYAPHDDVDSHDKCSTYSTTILFLILLYLFPFGDFLSSLASTIQEHIIHSFIGPFIVIEQALFYLQFQSSLFVLFNFSFFKVLRKVKNLNL